MRRQTKRAYKYTGKCIECDGSYSFFYTLPDYGDPPIISHCNNCGTLYWHDRDDETVRPLLEQIKNVNCVTCGSQLLYSLTPTHKYIKCTCGSVFSLDDDFFKGFNPSDEEMELIDVYLLYS